MKDVIIDTNACKGCNLCVLACPKNVLAMSKDYNENGYNYAQAIYPDSCIGCLFCVKVCPDICLEIRNRK